MTDFEKSVYSDMSSTDRILILMAKISELTEFTELMKALGDKPAVKKVISELGNSNKEAANA